LKLEKQQSIFLLTLIILSGFAAVLILILFAFRAKRKAQKEIVRQKQVIEEKQKELLDSIYYAKRIQTALVTSEYYIRKELIRLKRR
jgi:type II secretory pathway pseudopilin PulG